MRAAGEQPGVVRSADDDPRSARRAGREQLVEGCVIEQAVAPGEKKDVGVGMRKGRAGRLPPD